MPKWFKAIMYLKFLISGGLLALGLTACSSNDHPTDWTKEVIEQTRLCPQMLYKCLPESQDPKIQSKIKSQSLDEHPFSPFEHEWAKYGNNSLGRKIRLLAIHALYPNIKHAYELSEEQYQALGEHFKVNPDDLDNLGNPGNFDESFARQIVKELNMNYDDVYQPTKKESEEFNKYYRARSYQDVVQMLDIYFPGFWGEMPEEERLQWVELADKKKYKYPVFGRGQGDIESMAHICAILGIEWDQSSRNQRLVDFFTKQKYPGAGWDSVALFYLYFELLGRDYDFTGNHLNSFSLRGAFGSPGLADRPSRHLSMEAPDSGQYQAKYDLFGIYYYTVREGGKLKAAPKDYAEAIAWRETLKPDYRLNRQQEGQRVH